MPQKQWVVGEEVLAADFNTYVQNQVVATFTSSAERNAEIPTPATGQTCTVAGQFQVYRGGVWHGDTNSLIERQPLTWSVAGIAGTSGGTFSGIQAITVPAQPVAGTLYAWSFLRIDTGSMSSAYLVDLRRDTTVLASYRISSPSGANLVHQVSLSATYALPASTSVLINLHGSGTANVTTYAGPTTNRLDLMWVGTPFAA